jgi:hypothetical protein
MFLGLLRRAQDEDPILMVSSSPFDKLRVRKASSPRGKHPHPEENILALRKTSSPRGKHPHPEENILTLRKTSSS